MPMHTTTGAPSTGQIIQTVSTTALNILGNILGQREQRRQGVPGPAPVAITTARGLFSGQSGIVIIGALVLLFVLFRPGRRK